MRPVFKYKKALITGLTQMAAYGLIVLFIFRLNWQPQNHMQLFILIAYALFTIVTDIIHHGYYHNYAFSKLEGKMSFTSRLFYNKGDRRRPDLFYILNGCSRGMTLPFVCFAGCWDPEIEHPLILFAVTLTIGLPFGFVSTGNQKPLIRLKDIK